MEASCFHSFIPLFQNSNLNLPFHSFNSRTPLHLISNSKPNSTVKCTDKTVGELPHPAHVVLGVDPNCAAAELKSSFRAKFCRWFAEKKRKLTSNSMEERGRHGVSADGEEVRATSSSREEGNWDRMNGYSDQVYWVNGLLLERYMKSKMTIEPARSGPNPVQPSPSNQCGSYKIICDSHRWRVWLLSLFN